MLLHRDGMIELNYDVSSDILTVRWPDVSKFSFSEIKYSFSKLVETLKHYDIKKLLIDSRENLAESTDAEYSARLQELSRALFATRLIRVARLQTANSDYEQRVNSTTDSIKEHTQTAVAFRSFPTEEMALSWLQEV